jgi:hypothetical protein
LVATEGGTHRTAFVEGASSRVGGWCFDDTKSSVLLCARSCELLQLGTAFVDVRYGCRAADL